MKGWEAHVQEIAFRCRTQSSRVSTWFDNEQPSSSRRRISRSNRCRCVLIFWCAPCAMRTQFGLRELLSGRGDDSPDSIPPAYATPSELGGLEKVPAGLRCIVGIKMIAYPEKCFQQLLYWNCWVYCRPFLELVIVSSNFLVLLFSQDKLLESDWKVAIQVKKSKNVCTHPFQNYFNKSFGAYSRPWLSLSVLPAGRVPDFQSVTPIKPSFRFPQSQRGFAQRGIASKSSPKPQRFSEISEASF